MSRVIIAASSARMAKQWCRDSDVPPYSRDTLIAVSDVGLRGVAIRPEDRVVVVAHPQDHSGRWVGLLDELLRACRRGGHDRARMEVP